MAAAPYTPMKGDKSLKYTNKEIRRAIRKFMEHYGSQNTRKIIRLFAAAYNEPLQRISGNLTALEYCDNSITISTIIPHKYSLMN
jgi:hypothetical protein